MGGGRLGVAANGWRAGLSAVYSHLSRPLHPGSALYRRYYARGSDFLNASLDYGYTSHLLTLSGETATNKHGALATLNSASLNLSGRLTLLALQRFYSFRYTALHARSLCEGSGVQNESAVYLGLGWQPSRRWHLQAYTDYAYFPWARYQVSRPSHAWDNLFSATFAPGSWTLLARYRLHTRQKDNADKTGLLTQSEHRARLSAAWRHDRWHAKTQLDAAFANHQQGRMLTQQLGYAAKKLSGWLSVNWFSTASYDVRLYAYERGPLYSFSFPMFQGRGWRVTAMAQSRLARRLTLTAKLGTTYYTDRKTISTGYQQIDSPSMTDLDVQLAWQL